MSMFQVAACAYAIPRAGYATCTQWVAAYKPLLLTEVALTSAQCLVMNNWTLMSLTLEWLASTPTGGILCKLAVTMEPVQQYGDLAFWSATTREHSAATLANSLTIPLYHPSVMYCSHIQVLLHSCQPVTSSAAFNSDSFGWNISSDALVYMQSTTFWKRFIGGL